MLDILLKGYDELEEGVLITDICSHPVFLNKSFKKIWHIPEDITNLNKSITVNSILSGQILDPNPIQVIIDKIYDNPHIVYNQQIHLKEDITIKMISSPLYDDNNKLMGRLWQFIDITDSLNIIYSLKNSEELFRIIFNLIPEGIAISEIKTGKFYKVNTNFTHWWGYTQEEVVGKSAIDLNFWVDLKQRENIISILKNNGIFEKIPIKLRNKTGEIRDVLLSGKEIIIDKNSYMLSIPYDITDLIQYREKIISLASFIELSPDPIFEFDKFGTITMSNEASHTIMNKITGSDDISKFIPFEIDEILSAIINEEDKSFFREITLNNCVFLENIYTNSRFKTARVYVNDITLRKKAEEDLLKKNDDLAAAFEELLSAEEELKKNYKILLSNERALRESENRLSLIISHIPGILVTIDTENKVTGLYGTALSKLGLSMNQGIGKNLREIFKNTDESIIKAYSDALIGIKSTFEGKYNDRYIILYTEPLIDYNEEIIGTMGIAFDITDKKLLEKERNEILIQLEPCTEHF